MAPKMLATLTFQRGVSIADHCFLFVGCDDDDDDDDGGEEEEEEGAAAPAAATARRTEREREAGNTFPQHAS